MNSYVLDASVALAWYLDEEFSPGARIWQERLLNGKVVLTVPTLHYWEVANALRSLVFRRELSEAFAAEIYALHLDAPLETAEPDERNILEVALDYEATAYDAVYISLCLSKGLPLITAEKTTTAWVAKLADRVEVVR